ncbi:hypothetical protein RchiOBHm_Chr4g0404591 [Rosa chinensis]|uniref:Uncharacterized protein n=1 Tax=Rosa chinensis TaxID=74649 RepID=A0A2P6QTV4_ROSCH|nr:hypothetical protein RchiOBHm_Chr4g0404591 [Rosa chinensis]
MSIDLTTFKLNLRLLNAYNYFSNHHNGSSLLEAQGTHLALILSPSISPPSSSTSGSSMKTASYWWPEMKNIDARKGQRSQKNCLWRILVMSLRSWRS